MNSSLILLVGDDALYGLISLSGVENGDLSLKVPYKLAEQVNKRGAWLNFLDSLGYVFDKHFQDTHTFGLGFFPLIGAANHSDNGGRLEYKADCLELYGVDFCYSKRPDKRALHGIV